MSSASVLSSWNQAFSYASKKCPRPVVPIHVSSCASRDQTAMTIVTHRSYSPYVPSNAKNTPKRLLILLKFLRRMSWTLSAIGALHNLINYLNGTLFLVKNPCRLPLLGSLKLPVVSSPPGLSLQDVAGAAGIFGDGALGIRSSATKDCGENMSFNLL